MTRFRFAFALTAILATSACSPYLESSHVLTGPPQQPNAPSQVTVYMEGQQPPPGYTEIAIVEGRGDANVGMPGVLQRLKEDAARLGANALINVRIDQGGSVVSVTAVAVRY